MKLVQYCEYFISTVGTDGLVLAVHIDGLMQEKT